MSEELIQLPEISEIKELLSMAKRDVKTEVQNDPDALDASKLLIKVIDVIEEKTAQQKDLSKLPEKDKIDFAAHLNFLHCLLEDFFFMDDEEFDEDEDEDELNHFEDDEE